MYADEDASAADTGYEDEEGEGDEVGGVEVESEEVMFP